MDCNSIEIFTWLRANLYQLLQQGGWTESAEILWTIHWYHFRSDPSCWTYYAGFYNWIRNLIQNDNKEDKLMKNLMKIGESQNILINLMWTFFSNHQYKFYATPLYSLETVPLRDMTSRSVDSSMLRGLRTRILGLFLHYLRTPAFNPEARKFPRWVTT